mmetsp:Transcript_21414/g.59448  ORF Transcript_21414/g.59448 Transcript_21414/m.59448 type:complete len:293 (+) Transcript_21414:2687-3565(+)
MWTSAAPSSLGASSSMRKGSGPPVSSKGSSSSGHFHAMKVPTTCRSCLVSSRLCCRTFRASHTSDRRACLRSRWACCRCSCSLAGGEPPLGRPPPSAPSLGAWCSPPLTPPRMYSGRRFGSSGSSCQPRSACCSEMVMISSGLSLIWLASSTAGPTPLSLKMRIWISCSVSWSLPCSSTALSGHRSEVSCSFWSLCLVSMRREMVSSCSPMLAMFSRYSCEIFRGDQKPEELFSMQFQCRTNGIISSVGGSWISSDTSCMLRCSTRWWLYQCSGSRRLCFILEVRASRSCFW